MRLRVLSDQGDVLHLVGVEHKVQPTSPLDFTSLEKLLGTCGYAQPVVLSMAETRFIDSSGLSWLVICHKRFVQAGGRLVLHSVTPAIMELFKMMRLELVLEIAESEAAAMELVGKERP